MRLFSLLLAACAALALVLLSAADETVVEGFAPEDYPLLPISEIQRDYLVRDHADLVMRLTILGQRAQRVTAHIRERKDAADAGSAQLVSELQRIRGQLAPLTAELRPLLVGLGVPEDTFERIARGPKGALREERYAHALALDAPGASPEARALLERLVPATDGALLALLPQGQAAATQVKETEKRFWRVVDALLEVPAKRWIRLHLPTEKSQYQDVIGHVYRLSGLTASQGSQIKALLVELEAQAAPDAAAIHSAEERLKAKDLPEADRSAAQREKDEAGRRAIALRIGAFERALKILTPEQLQELQAVPPELTSADRQENPKDIVEKIDLRPEQQAKLAAMAQRYEGEKKRIEQEVLRVALQQKEFGADSPEQDRMTMEYVGIQNRVQQVVHEATRRILLEILTPEQVVLWVLGAGKAKPD